MDSIMIDGDWWPTREPRENMEVSYQIIKMPPSVGEWWYYEDGMGDISKVKILGCLSNERFLVRQTWIDFCDKEVVNRKTLICKV